MGGGLGDALGDAAAQGLDELLQRSVGVLGVVKLAADGEDTAFQRRRCGCSRCGGGSLSTGHDDDCEDVNE